MITIDLKDKVVLITGTSSGIGYASALKYLEAGYSVCGLDIKTSELSHNIDEYICDLSNEKEVKRTFEVIQEKYMCINYVINCAGIFFDNNRFFIDEMSMVEWNGVLTNNLNSYVHVTQHVIPLLKNATGDKAIVNISSDQALYPRKKNSAYAASKAGILNFSHACAIELLDEHIRVNCVLPASVRSNFIRKIFDNDDKMEKIYMEENEKMPFGIIEPEEVAELVYFLGSEKSKKITGQFILMNSGMYI